MSSRLAVTSRLRAIFDTMLRLDLSDNERAILITALRRLVDFDPQPLSPHIQALQAILATVSEAASLLQGRVPDLLAAADAVLIDGSSTSLTKQAEAAGAKILMMTGSPDRIIEFDGAGQPYLSKPFSSEAFLQRVGEILTEG